MVKNEFIQWFMISAKKIISSLNLPNVTNLNYHKPRIAVAILDL